MNNIDECLENATYICKHNGGNGAVREFVNEIIRLNKNIIEKLI